MATGADQQLATHLPAPKTFAPSREDVLSTLSFFFGDPAVPEKLRDYSEHHAMTYHFPDRSTVKYRSWRDAEQPHPQEPADCPAGVGLPFARIQGSNVAWDELGSTCACSSGSARLSAEADFAGVTTATASSGAASGRSSCAAATASALSPTLTCRFAESDFTRRMPAARTSRISSPPSGLLRKSQCARPTTRCGIPPVLPAIASDGRRVPHARTTIRYDLQKGEDVAHCNPDLSVSALTTNTSLAGLRRASRARRCSTRWLCTPLPKCARLEQAHTANQHRPVDSGQRR